MYCKPSLQSRQCIRGCIVRFCIDSPDLSTALQPLDSGKALQHSPWTAAVQYVAVAAPHNTLSGLAPDYAVQALAPPAGQEQHKSSLIRMIRAVPVQGKSLYCIVWRQSRECIVPCSDCNVLYCSCPATVLQCFALVKRSQ